MEKSRSIRELLIIVRDNLKRLIEKDEENGGICAVTRDLWQDGLINYYERCRLLDYLDQNKPAEAKKRENRPEIYDKNGFAANRFWWRPRAVAPRIKWLDEQIKSL